MSATNDSAPPNLTLDRTREFGLISPPEQLLCANGRFIPTAYREERPTQYERFVAQIAGAETEYKTRCYEQDGFSFDADGRIVEECLDVDALKRARRMETERLAEQAAREAHEKIMREHGFSSDFVGYRKPAYARPVTAQDAASNPNDGPVIDGRPRIESTFDVKAWAAGRNPAPWFAVQKAIFEQHHYRAQSKEQALDWLRENHVIPAAV